MLVQEGVPIGLPLIVLADDVRIFAASFVSHNADFDVRVVGAAYHREGMVDAVGGLDRLCTMKAAAGQVGDRGGKWPTLDELIEDLFAEKREGAHRALADVRDTARAFGALRERGLMDLAAPERMQSFDIDLRVDAPRVRNAIDRYMKDLNALPTYYDPANIEGIGDERFVRAVVRRMSPHYRPDVADCYWTPYDAVSSRMALSLSAEDEVAKYLLAIALEKAIGLIPSALRYSGDALERAVATRVPQGLPVVTKLDVRQFYSSVDHARLVNAVQDMTGLAADEPFLDALRGSLTIPFRREGSKERRRGLSIGVTSEAYLAELFMERVEQDIRQADVEVVRLNDEFYVFSESLRAGRNDFVRVYNALLGWGLTLERSKTRVTHHRPSYGDVEKHVVRQTIFNRSTQIESWGGVLRKRRPMGE